MKPTYEELEAQETNIVGLLTDIMNDYNEKECCCQINGDETDCECYRCFMIENIDKAIAAHQDLLTRLETLEKALDAACCGHAGCPPDEEANCLDNCTQWKCWKDYFLKRAGESK